MTNRFHLAALVPAFLGGLLLAASPAAAAERYMVQGLPFFAPYRLAIATYDVAGEKVSGTLSAPVGDPRPPVPLSGTLKDGKLDLTIGSGADAVSLTFIKDERDRQRLWVEAAPVADLSQVVLFRPVEGFSATALALQHADTNWCGRFTGGLSVELRASALKASATAPADLADLDVVLASRAATPTVKLSAVWQRLRLAARSGEDVAIDIEVPPGREAARAEALRKLPQVAAVDLPAGCGEMALVAVPRDKIMTGDKVSDEKLKSFADGVLERFLSGAKADAAAPGALKFRLDDAKVVRGADGLVHYEARLVGNAEATRLGEGEVDAFTLSLTPMETVADTDETLSLIPQVSGLKVARRLGSSMPPESAFEAEPDEAVAVGIVHRFVSWLAAYQDTECAFLTRSAFEEPDEALTCGNITLDALDDDSGGD